MLLRFFPFPVAAVAIFDIYHCLDGFYLYLAHIQHIEQGMAGRDYVDGFFGQPPVVGGLVRVNEANLSRDVFGQGLPQLVYLLADMLYLLRQGVVDKFPAGDGPCQVIGSFIRTGFAFGYFRFYFVFGEGVRSGQLNYVVYKGVLWKTYEGKLIQTGIRSQSSGTIQSNTFEFSVADKELAEQLMKQSGKTMDIHYKEYFGRLPWRGHSKYIVDRIEAIRENGETIKQLGDSDEDLSI